MLKFLSNKSIVIAAAKTGKEINNKKLTVSCAIINNGYWKNEIKLLIGKINIVTIKFIDDKIEDAPAKCNEKIIKSVET